MLPYWLLFPFWVSMRTPKGELLRLLTLTISALLLLLCTDPLLAMGNSYKCKFSKATEQLTSVNTQKISNIKQADLANILAQIFTAFFPIVKNLGAQLILTPEWQNQEIGAFASQNDNRWIVKVTGGLARHSDMTIDALTLIICHELGHHLGGAPKIPFTKGNWSSAEGQSDYFATLKCVRRLWSNDDNNEIVTASNAYANLPQSVSTSCIERFEESNSVALCIRTALASLQVSKYLAQISGAPRPLFESPDRTRAPSTIWYHPSIQCRLDTFFQGALCEANYRDPLGERPSRGACTRISRQSVGSRPLCWYRPPILVAPLVDSRH